MDLLQWGMNIKNLNVEEIIKQSINNVTEKLSILSKERTCLIYSSYIYNELKEKNIISRLINTKDLDYDYEHQFVLVPLYNEECYYIIDLTFSQFIGEKDNIISLDSLLNEGYQKINNDLWCLYLEKILNTKEIKYSLDEAYDRKISYTKK